jgi:hypothetical protein
MYPFLLTEITGDNVMGPILCIRPPGIFAQNGTHDVIASDLCKEERVHSVFHEAADLTGLTVNQLTNLIASNPVGNAKCTCSFLQGTLEG